MLHEAQVLSFAKTVDYSSLRANAVFYRSILLMIDILFFSNIELLQAEVQRIFLYVLTCAKWQAISGALTRRGTPRSDREGVVFLAAAPLSSKVVILGTIFFLF